MKSFLFALALLFLAVTVESQLSFVKREYYNNAPKCSSTRPTGVEVYLNHTCYGLGRAKSGKVTLKQNGTISKSIWISRTCPAANVRPASNFRYKNYECSAANANKTQGQIWTAGFPSTTDKDLVRIYYNVRSCKNSTSTRSFQYFEVFNNVLSNCVGPGFVQNQCLNTTGTGVTSGSYRTFCGRGFNPAPYVPPSAYSASAYVLPVFFAVIFAAFAAI